MVFLNCSYKSSQFAYIPYLPHILNSLPQTLSLRWRETGPLSNVSVTRGDDGTGAGDGLVSGVASTPGHVGVTAVVAEHLSRYRHLEVVVEVLKAGEFIKQF